MPNYTDSGLRAADALTVVEVACDHPKWSVLNKATGCIHADHGEWPPALVDQHSGVRLVDGAPTRYVPAS